MQIYHSWKSQVNLISTTTQKNWEYVGLLENSWEPFTQLLQRSTIWENVGETSAIEPICRQSNRPLFQVLNWCSTIETTQGWRSILESCDDTHIIKKRFGGIMKILRYSVILRFGFTVMRAEVFLLRCSKFWSFWRRRSDLFEYFSKYRM